MSFAENALADTKFTPFWLDSPAAPSAVPALKRDISTDLLIVGGGFTGLWSAILAKEEAPERRVTLIEAGRIAHGASGRPGAIVSTSVMHGLSNASRIFPNDIEELERLGQENMDGFLDTLKRHQIDCDHEWTGELTVGVNGDSDADLKKEYDLHKRYGHDVVLLDGDDTRQQLNSPLFTAGLWSRKRSGILNPAKLAWGLRQAALNLGVEIYEHTPLTGVQRCGNQVSVKVPDALIIANKVLLATNAFAAGHKKIRRCVAAIRDRIVVTNPLSDEQLARIGWTNRQGVYDTRTQMNYMRLTKDNRILFGGRLGYFYGNETDPDEDKCAAPFIRLAQAFHRTFPQLDDVKFTHAWSGPIALTTRMAVHFQRYFGGKMIYAGGYSGFGVSASRFGARIGLAILDDKDIPEKQMAFARTKPAYIPPEPFRWLGAKLTLYAMDTADQKGGWRLPWIRFVERFGFPLT